MVPIESGTVYPRFCESQGKCALFIKSKIHKIEKNFNMLSPMPNVREIGK